MKRETLTHKIVRLAIFLALGIVLNIIESMIPIPIPIPGVRLGLANTMGLIVLFFYSPKDYVAIGFLRVFFVALLRTGLGSISSLVSFSGWFISSIISLLIYSLKKASIYGLSVTSALFHQVGQLIMIMILYESVSIINYLPVLLVTGAISGVLVALISERVLRLLSRIFKVKIIEKENLKNTKLHNNSVKRYIFVKR